MTGLKRFVLMVQFLTTIPIPLDLKATSEDYGKGLIFAPVIGYLIGGILCLTFYVSSMLTAWGFPQVATLSLIHI